jgi:gamma-glutamyltranspeptidase/glutathione hydrolase
MQLGGNAVDAAVTAALVAGVVSSSSSGIGGGAFIHYFDSTSGKSVILDARESAPAGLVAQDFESRPFAPEQRGKYVGVPGEVAGLFTLHAQFGKRSWTDVVTPAVRAAAEGFEIEPHLTRSLEWEREALKRDPGLNALWLAPGHSLRHRARVKNPWLAETLRRIGAEGPKAFYEGTVAAEMVNVVSSRAGTLSLKDLREYRVQKREALSARWGVHEVRTMPPPSAGGLMLLQAMKLWTPEQVAHLGYNTPALQHALAESFRASIADRHRYVSDPAFQKVDTDLLLADARLARRKQQISMGRTHAIPSFQLEEGGTHHLITADESSVVTLTTTVNTSFGAKLMAPNSGVLLNDELDDFTSSADARAFGLKESPNRARPGARPVSSMTPTLVLKDGKVVLAAGGSGGMTIAPNVSQVVMSRLVFGIEPYRLLTKGRFQVPSRGGSIALQDAPKTHVADLERRGEVVDAVRFNFSAVQLLAIDEQGRKEPASDPRKHGHAMVQ